MSEKQKRDGPRSSYIGSEVFITVVDAAEAPYPALQQLSVLRCAATATCPC